VKPELVNGTASKQVVLGLDKDAKDRVCQMTPTKTLNSCLLYEMDCKQLQLYSPISAASILAALVQVRSVSLLLVSSVDFRRLSMSSSRYKICKPATAPSLSSV